MQDIHIQVLIVYSTFATRHQSIMETRASCLDYSNKSLHVPGLSEEENINLHLWLCSRPELQINLTTDIHLIFALFLQERHTLMYLIPDQE